LDSFKIHQLQLRGRHYLMLPKLNSAQTKILRDRLVRLGYHVRAGAGLRAKSKEGTIFVDPAGFCRSTFDPSDVIYPAIPELLAAKKELLPLEVLASLYFALEVSDGTTVARVSTRVESSTNWDALRTLGRCALAPDEWAVSSFLMSHSKGGCEVVTDFPSRGSVPRICGRRRYYDSILHVSQVASTLCVVGQKGSRNTYIPRSGILRLKGKVSPSHEKVFQLLAGLGEWCSLSPA
jgi:hypothetical protein